MRHNAQTRMPGGVFSDTREQRRSMNFQLLPVVHPINADLN